MINLGNANYKLVVEGANEALEKLDDLEKKLIEVKSLIDEITSMKVNLCFFDTEKPEGV